MTLGMLAALATGMVMGFDRFVKSPGWLFQRLAALARIAYDARKLDGFLRSVELLACVLPGRVRQRHFQPAFYEDKKQYLLDRRIHRSKQGRIWLALCFLSNVIILIVQTAWGMLGGGLEKVILAFIPAAVREVLKRLFGL
jgi:hypothetical protein